MRVEGMSIVRGALGRLIAVVALASGLVIASPARAESWKDALREADDLHEAAEDLHERAHRLHDHHALPVTTALDQAAADLYHALKHRACAAEVVPLLNTTEALLNETSSVMALSCEMHHDRKAVALLKDARHHFVHTAEHIEHALHHHTGAPTVRYSHPQQFVPTSPYGTSYSLPPAWINQSSPPVQWGSSYHGSSHGHNKHAVKPHYNEHRPYHTGVEAHAPRPLARVLISELLK